MAIEIKRGDRFICKNPYGCDEDGNHIFCKGKIYLSTIGGCLNSGDKHYSFSMHADGDWFTDVFEWISPMYSDYYYIQKYSDNPELDKKVDEAIQKAIEDKSMPDKMYVPYITAATNEKPIYDTRKYKSISEAAECDFLFQMKKANAMEFLAWLEKNKHKQGDKDLSFMYDTFAIGKDLTE